MFSNILQNHITRLRNPPTNIYVIYQQENNQEINDLWSAFQEDQSWDRKQDKEAKSRPVRFRGGKRNDSLNALSTCPWLIGQLEQAEILYKWMRAIWLSLHSHKSSHVYILLYQLLAHWYNHLNFTINSSLTLSVWPSVLRHYDVFFHQFSTLLQRHQSVH